MKILLLVKNKIKELYNKVRTFFNILSGNEIFYIGGSETLPPPLSMEEEATALEKLKNKDEKAKKVLVERNLRLVVYIAKKFENSGVNIEDLISIGTIGLMKAINTFNTEKNIKLATYASRCIENEILMYLRRNNRTKNEVSIDEPLNTDGDGNELLLSDILGSEEDGVFKNLETEADKRLIGEYLEHLTSREKYIMELRFRFSVWGRKDSKRSSRFIAVFRNRIFPELKRKLFTI